MNNFKTILDKIPVSATAGEIVSFLGITALMSAARFRGYRAKLPIIIQDSYWEPVIDVLKQRFRRVKVERV